MTQLEIATRILCSGKANTPDEAWILAGELIDRDEEVNHNIEDYTGVPIDETIEKLEYLEDRTAKRTQQVIDLGFEWNENEYLFTKDIYKISTVWIESKSDDEWDEIISKHDPTLQAIETINEAFPTESNEPIIEDLFKGEGYIEFEMDKSMCRLYKLNNKILVEDDLQVTKKTESKFIITSSENEEHGLGITIFKK